MDKAKQVRAVHLVFAMSLLALTACENINFSELASTFSAGGGAMGAAVVTTNPVIIGGAAVASGVTTAALTPETNSVTAEQIAEVQNPWQALLVAFDQLLAHAFELVIAIGLAVFAVPMLITYLLGRVKQRPEDAKAISNLVNKIGEMDDPKSKGKAKK